jgi:hypothetical protein
MTVKETLNAVDLDVFKCNEGVYFDVGLEAERQQNSNDKLEAVK